MAIEKKERNNRIKAQIKAGKSFGKLSKSTGLTKSRVWEIVHQKRINVGKSKRQKAK